MKKEKLNLYSAAFKIVKKINCFNWCRKKIDKKFIEIIDTEASKQEINTVIEELSKEYNTNNLNINIYDFGYDFAPEQKNRRIIIKLK